MTDHTPRFNTKYRFKGSTLPFTLAEIDGETAYFVTRQGEESRTVSRQDWDDLRLFGDKSREPDYTTGPCKPLVLADLRRLVDETAHLSPVTIVNVHRPDPGTHPAKHTTKLDVLTGSLATGRKFDSDLIRVGDLLTQANALDILAVGSRVTDADGRSLIRGYRGIVRAHHDIWYETARYERDRYFEYSNIDIALPAVVDSVADRERGMRKTSAKYSAQRLAAEERTI